MAKPICINYYFCVLNKFLRNKESAESGVTPAGIKSHKFLFELKKNAAFKRLMALFVRKMDKVENLECLYQGYGILEEELVIGSQRHSVIWFPVCLYAKYDQNPSIFSQDIGRTPFAHFQKIT